MDKLEPQSALVPTGNLAEAGGVLSCNFSFTK